MNAISFAKTESAVGKKIESAVSDDEDLKLL